MKTAAYPKTEKEKFYVWRRNDGYVSATCIMPHSWTSADGEVSFTIIGIYSSWADAKDAIELARR